MIHKSVKKYLNLTSNIYATFVAGYPKNYNYKFTSIQVVVAPFYSSHHERVARDPVFTRATLEAKN